MGRGTRKRKPIGPSRQLLAENLLRLVGRHYALSSNAPLDLAMDLGCSTSQAQRLLKAQVGASVDTLDRLARLFDLSPYQLLLPQLDPANPQVVANASADERALYKRVRRVSLKNPARS